GRNVGARFSTRSARPLREAKDALWRSPFRPTEAPMHPLFRLFGIIGVFILASVAWAILGGVTSSRTSDQQANLDGRVADLWGSPETQAAPTFDLRWMEEETKTEQITDANGKTSTKKTVEMVQRVQVVDPVQSRIHVDLH